jgi:hypothetical protein
MSFLTKIFEFMMKAFFVLMLIGAGMHQAIGQEDFLWKGRVIDGDSGLPIEGVHLKSDNRQVITDRDGFFSIYVRLGDLMVISHVSYQTMQYRIEDKAVPSLISLSVLVQELGEVTVTSLPSEAQLKQLLLYTPYYPPLMEIHLQQNMAYMKTIHSLNNNHLLNALDFSYKRLNSGNGEATLLSSNPSMGIMGVIRSFRKPGAIPFDKPSPYRHPATFKFKSDTTFRYSDYFEKQE